MDEPEELNEEIDEEEAESIISDEDVEDLEDVVVLDEEQIDDDDDDEEYGEAEAEAEAEAEVNKQDLGELNFIKSDSYKSSFIFNDDLETNDSNEFLQKFNKDFKNDFIASNHQECFSKNLDEITNLLEVIRDKNNIIIDELHKTIPILTKYEKTRILGIRIKQLNNGALPYIKVSEDLLDNFIIAEKELKEKKYHLLYDDLYQIIHLNIGN